MFLPLLIFMTIIDLRKSTFLKLDYNKPALNVSRGNVLDLITIIFNGQVHYT